MSQNIYAYDITDTKTAISTLSKSNSTKQIYLGVSENSYSNNSLTPSTTAQKDTTSNNTTTTKQNNILKASYTTYGYTDSQVPVFSTKNQEELKQEYIDWLQNERLKYMEAFVGSTSESGETSGSTISGKTEAEQEIINNGGIANVVTKNTDTITSVKEILETHGITSGDTKLDAGSW